MWRIVQISDTHLSVRGGAPADNFERMVAFVASLSPDLIVHTGDVVAASPEREADREAATRALATLSAIDAPLRVLPGNHDVGSPDPEAWMGLRVSGARVAAHRRAFGPDRFLELSETWALLGINSELLGSGLPDEHEQWAWIEGALREAGERRIVLFSHKPLWSPCFEPRGEALNVPEAERERLLSLVGERLSAVASGHLHRHRRRRRGQVEEVWAPAVGFRGREGVEPLDLNQLGVVEWRLDERGAHSAFRAPLGLDERHLEEIPELMAVLAEVTETAESAETRR